MRKLTTQEFIDRARVVHGDKYGYAFAIYLSANNKVMIQCKEHGMFEQTPAKHMSGQGCKKCYGNEIHTNESFIKKAIKIHGYKYDYSNVEYRGGKVKIKIICPLHGEFEQTPENHLYGYSCNYCGGRNKLETRDFIERSKSVHGNKYDYSNVVYARNRDKVKIGCLIHGEFEQVPEHHWSGSGCPTCSSLKITTLEFIERAKLIHSDKYDYSLVEYVSAINKVKIVCKIHGKFEQNAYDHIKGCGCPGCANYGFDRTKTGFLYVLRSDCGRYMKIGITNKPEQRHMQLSKSTPFSFKRVELIEGQGEQIANLEKQLLAEYQQAEFTDAFDGYTEWRLFNASIRNKLLTSKL